MDQEGTIISKEINKIQILWRKHRSVQQKAAHVFSITDTKLSENNPLLLCAEVCSCCLVLAEQDKYKICNFQLGYKTSCTQAMPKYKS